MLAMKEKMSDLCWNIRFIPTAVKAEIITAEMSARHKRIKRLEKRTTKQEELNLEKEEMKKAAEKDPDFKVSDKVKGAVATVSDKDGFDKMIMLENSMKTSKLLQYVLYYLSDPKAKLIKLNDEKKSFANGVAALFGFDKIYESADVMDILKCDPTNQDAFDPNLQFVLSIDELKKKAESYVDAMKERKEQLAAESEHPEDDDPDAGVRFPFLKDKDGVIHPLFFNFNPNDLYTDAPKKGTGISDSLFEKLEKVFSPILEDQSYRYEMKGDLVSLFVKRSYGFEEEYVVDPGVVMGLDKIYILSKLPNDTIFVSVSDHPEIVKKTLHSIFYLLEPEEAQLVMMDYFMNQAIYRFIDMSDTEFLANLSKDDFNKLGKKLSFIINQLLAMNNGNPADVPRFRFDKFKSVDDFSIVSDSKVISPMADSGVTSAVICDNLSFIINGDNVKQKLNEIEINYKIEKYAEM